MKKCFKCEKVKPVSQFYVHKRMGDGRLGKCKTCTQKDSAERIARKWKDPEWVAGERSRCREKQNRYRKLGLASRPTEESQKRWALKNKVKRAAQSKAAFAQKSKKIIAPNVCQGCGGESKLSKHHPDYSKPLWVWWLCSTCHGKAHHKNNPLIIAA